MVTTTKAAPSGAVATLVEAARAESAAGDLHGAWATAQRALGRCLRDRYLARTGKFRSPVTTPHGLAAKLRNAGAIDRWTWRQLEQLINPPTVVQPVHIEAVLAFSLAFNAEGEQCIG